MRLNSHQKEIVDAIIAGDVFDIKSYLLKFGKAKKQKYSEEELISIFKQYEDGKKYFYEEIDSNYFTNIFDSQGNHLERQAIPYINIRHYPFREYPIFAPVEAMPIKDIKSEVVEFNGQSYRFDFFKNEFWVATDFKDIQDFIILWYYLKKENLIIEVSKRIELDDLGVLFEQQPQKLDPPTTPQWDRRLVINVPDNVKGKSTTEGIYVMPTKSLNEYIANRWKMNQEHLTMCSEYIGKKILPTEKLSLFAKHFYITSEEWQYRIPLYISIIALIVSIIPMIQSWTVKSESDYLSEINQQLNVIERKIESDLCSQDVLSELIEIKDELADISKQFDSDDSAEIIANLTSQIEELNRLLSEPENPEAPTE